MSYDLMVFDPQSAPLEREKFMAWYRKQTEWSEGHKYDDPEVTTPELRAWFMEIIQHFPAMDGPYRSEDLDAEEMSDYSIGRSLIYAGFSWEYAEAAYDAVFRIAEKHRVGFFDVSADEGGVWVPQQDGSLVCIHGTPGPRPSLPAQSKKKWWEFWK
jgi:hypothetical protein